MPRCSRSTSAPDVRGACVILSWQSAAKRLDLHNRYVDRATVRRDVRDCVAGLLAKDGRTERRLRAIDVGGVNAVIQAQQLARAQQERVGIGFISVESDRHLGAGGDFVSVRRRFTDLSPI